MAASTSGSPTRDRVASDLEPNSIAYHNKLYPDADGTLDFDPLCYAPRNSGRLLYAVRGSRLQSFLAPSPSTRQLCRLALVSFVLAIPNNLAHVPLDFLPIAIQTAAVPHHVQESR